jgi:hypothetical protein
MERTKSGTIITCGIEYTELPPPKLLVKAMKKKWADPLIKDGLLRIQNIECFKKWENKILGDHNDGEGLYHLKNHPMQMGSVHDVYAWCLSLPEISSDRINLFAKHSGYDCLVVLQNPEMLFKRIKNWFSKKLPGYWLHCGLVKYDRGKEVDKKTLNSQKFHYNVFQKAADFKEDLEYRLSVTNTTFSRLSEEYIDLLLGDCRDILSIEKLPNMSLLQTDRAGRAC